MRTKFIAGRDLRTVKDLNYQCPASRNAKLADRLEVFENRVGAPVADLTALAAVDADNRYDNKMVAVSERGWYRFDAESAETADGARVVAPDAGTGRWKAQGAQSSGGGITWVRAVMDRDIVDSAGAVATEGNRYLIGGTGATDWAGHDNEIAEYTSDGVWIFTALREGLCCEIKDEDKVVIYNGSAWVDFGLMVEIDTTQIAYVDGTAGSDTTGQVGNLTRPYKTIGAAITACGILTPAADKRFKVVVRNGEYAENVVCAQYIDLHLGSARIVAASGDALKLQDDMSVWGGVLSAAAGYCFDVSAVDTTPAHVYGAQYAAGKVVKTGTGGAYVYFHDVMPLPGASITTFCDTSNAGTLGIFYNCELAGAMGSDDAAELYGCVCTGAWTTGDNIWANSTRFVGNFSLTSTSAASHFEACRFGGTFTALEAAAILIGCQFATSVLMNHASADISFSGCFVGTTYTVTLGSASFSGGSIGGAVSATGTGSATFDGSYIAGAMTALEATVNMDGGRVVGAMLVNHASAVFVSAGTRYADTFTVTLGEATVDGATITGAVSFAGTNTNRLAGCSLESTLTVLEATVLFAGGTVEGAAVTNHGSAILNVFGSIFQSTFDTTLGAGLFVGGNIVGNIDVSGGTMVLSASTEFGGTITGTPTYVEDGRYGECVRDIGGAGFAFINLTGVPNVDDAFTVAGRSYEWDTTGAGVNLTRTPGNVSASLDAAVTEINADAAGDGTVHALKGVGAAAGHGTLILIGETVNVDFALVVTVDVAVAMTASVANSEGDKAAAFRSVATHEHTVNAQDVLALAAGDGIPIGGIPSTAAPTVETLFAQDVNGAIIPLNTYEFHLTQAGANFYIGTLEDVAAAAGLAAGDTITVKVLI